MPSFEKIIAAGQKPVIEACSMLAPTKAVKAKAHGVHHIPRATLIKMKLPAIAKTARSKFILLQLWFCILVLIIEAGTLVNAK